MELSRIPSGSRGRSVSVFALSGTRCGRPLATAYDDCVGPARRLCPSSGSEWVGVETTPQRPKILKPPPNHPPQNKPPNRIHASFLSLAPISNRALNPSSCFEPGLSMNLPSDHPPLTLAASPVHTTRLDASLSSQGPPLEQSICRHHFRVVLASWSSCHALLLSCCFPSSPTSTPLDSLWCLAREVAAGSNANQCVLLCDPVFGS